MVNEEKQWRCVPQIHISGFLADYRAIPCSIIFPFFTTFTTRLED